MSPVVFNDATRTSKIMFLACIMFLLDNALQIYLVSTCVFLKYLEISPDYLLSSFPSPSQSSFSPSILYLSGQLYVSKARNFGVVLESSSHVSHIHQLNKILSFILFSQFYVCLSVATIMTLVGLFFYGFSIFVHLDLSYSRI